MSGRTRSGDRIAWAVFFAAAGVALAMAAVRVVASPAGRVLLPGDPWIEAAEPFTAMKRQWGRDQVPLAVFARDFDLARVPANASLSVRAFGDFAVALNGSAVSFDAAQGGRWQVAAERDVAALLRRGANRLEVQVRNRRGPALLSLGLIVDGDVLLTSDEAFAASVAGRPAEAARIASDVRRHPGAAWLPEPASATAGRAPVLAALLALGTAAFWLASRRGLGVDSRWLTATLVACTALWLALLAARFVPAPVGQGFDARGHAEYVALIRAEARFPLATEGWSTYHPPLYHLVVASLESVGDRLGDGALATARRLPAFLAGLGLVWLSAALARRLHPGRPGLAALAAAFAALLPVNVYTAGTLTNEGLLAVCVAGALVLAVHAMLEPVPTHRTLAALSGCLGLALLTKFTALVAVLVIGAFVLARIAFAARAGGGSAPARVALLVLPAAALAGWFYLRNALVYGRPLVGNWDLPGPGRTWWTAPGYHTADYYTGFGRALDEPWWAAFASFWDALYSTLWGDGLLSGAGGVVGLALAWDFEWMAVGYWMALPMSVVVLLGLARWLGDVRRDPEPLRRAALALPLAYTAALGFAIFYATLSLPFFGQARASYLLSATPVLALGFARGAAALHAWADGRRLPEALLAGVLFTAGATFALGFLG